MANTKKNEKLHCNCGGYLVKGKVHYEGISLDGLVCNGCGDEAFTWHDFWKAKKIIELGEVKSDEKIQQKENMITS